MPSLAYRFSGTYSVQAPQDRVISALRDADHWPDWWPQVRSVVRFDETTGLATVRSLLPITLRLGLTREVDDPAAGVLRARISGDLVGWIEFRVRGGAHASTSVSYAQECRVTKPALERSGALLRPLLVVNHRMMMRSGIRGLQGYVST